MVETLTDSVLGILTRGKAGDEWVGNREISPGHSVQFTLAAEVPADAESIAYFRAVIEMALADDLFIRHGIADDMLETYNGSWADDEDEREERGDDFHEQLSRNEFAAKLTLTSLTCGDERHMTAYYDDGEMFLGHGLCADFDLDRNVTYVLMFG